MSLQVNDVAPDFEADTAEGRIRFHDWVGDSWVVLFAHPKDFTPVGTTELGHIARIKPEFTRRHTKIIVLSVGATQDHRKWASDIEETQGTAPNYPIVEDSELKISKLYKLVATSPLGDAARSAPADNHSAHNVFVVGPDKKIRSIFVYPMTTGLNIEDLLRVLDALQLATNHKVAAAN